MPPTIRGVATVLLAGTVFATPSIAQQDGSGYPAASRPGEVAARVATVRGRVVDAEGDVPIPAVQVFIEGTRRAAVTNNNGEYSIAGVPAGTVTLRAMRIGYQPMNKPVTVPENGEVVVNFSLAKAVTRLEEVVTTATGIQARRELGNVVSSLKADSLVATAPVTTVQQLLQARTANLQIIQGTGATGATPTIRIRGVSSLSLTNDPLVILDGVRFEGSSGLAFTQYSSSRLSDLNPNEIESIDVIKGPAAAALYGTAATNGVLVIKTKRGVAGNAQWSFFLEQGLVEQPSKFEDNWRSWGRNLNAQGQPVGGDIQCKISQSSLGQCRVDSLTRNNPFTNPLTSPFRTASGGLRRTPRVQWGGQVSGGTEFLRYFVSAVREHETGPFVMPDSEVKRITNVRGTAPRTTQRYPNQLDVTSLRGNFQIGLSKTATLGVSTGYIDKTLFTPFDGGFFAGMFFQLFTAPGCVKCSATLRNDGQYTLGTQREYMGDIFSVELKSIEKRFLSSTQLNWQPKQWLNVRGVVGIDQASNYGYQLQLLSEGTNQQAAWGPSAGQGFSGKGLSRTLNTKYSVDLGATATRAVTSSVQSRTTLGAQWFKDNFQSASGSGYGFGPGVSTPNSASQRLISEGTTENATYGWYIEEQVSHRDRLFGTVGIRQDQNSAFGRTTGAAIYPRFALSYVISDETWFPKRFGLDQLRLRAALGQSGVQPGTTAALAFLGAQAFTVGAADQPGLVVSSIGNPDLRPEKTIEFEIGADLSFLDERVSVEVQTYNKQSHDALLARPLPPSFGAGGSQTVNIAGVENRGQEVTFDIGIIRSGPYLWNVRLSGSRNKNKIVSVGDVVLSTSPGVRRVVGFPISALWDRKILGYKDANGDGILTESEVQVDTVTGKYQGQSFRGSALPEYEAALNNRVSLFRGKVDVTALFDYRGGYWNSWGYQNQRCVSTANCRAVNDPKAPLADQAAALMAASSANRTQWGLFVPNDFIRLRELSVVYNLPASFTTRFLRGRSANIALSGRNIKVVWTKFPGLDPEANSGGQAANDFFSEPPLRYWITRVNVAF
jgi:TonB-linked SusC/RagA family outer membrane protein